MPWTPAQKREKYAELRAEIEKLIGPRCAACGSEGEWDVDHKGGGRTYSARRMNSIARLRRYLEDAKKGIVQRLCKSCNGADGDTRRFYQESLIDNNIVT